MREGLRILYVDDDHNDLALFGLAVEQTSLNIDLFTAVDGQQAIDYLEGRAGYSDRDLFPFPDIILLDLRMALTSGLEFLAWRKKTGFDALPVMLFSSDTGEDERKKALALGAGGYMEKPQTFVDLKKAIHQLWDWSIQRCGEAQSSGSQYMRRWCSP